MQKIVFRKYGSHSRGYPTAEDWIFPITILFYLEHCARYRRRLYSTSAKEQGLQPGYVFRISRGGFLITAKHATMAQTRRFFFFFLSLSLFSFFLLLFFFFNNLDCADRWERREGTRDRSVLASLYSICNRGEWWLGSGLLSDLLKSMRNDLSVHYGLEMETEVEIETIVKRSVISGRYEAWVIVGVMGVMRGDNNENVRIV